ncbi:hypothetical protein PENSPDRAFT_462439 [Peniophora sp. CONT]|nr:hypothetical protein PENSPDRAFT_462439 [Peniophora sp. CONT]
MLRAVARALYGNPMRRPRPQVLTTGAVWSLYLLDARLQPGAIRCSSSSSEAAPSTSHSPSASRSIRSQRNYKAHYSGRSCSCGSQLSSYWHRDPDSGGPLCKICYGRRKTERDNSGTNSCLDCGTKTSANWYTHPSTGTLSRCQSCKIRHRTEQHELAGTICRDCGTTKASRWAQDPSRDGSFRCRTCQNREWIKHAVFPGRSCVECGSQATGKEWHKHPSGNNTFWCNTCYQRAYDADIRACSAQGLKQRRQRKKNDSDIGPSQRLEMKSS